MSTIPFHSSIYVRISLTTGIKILKFVVEYLKGGGGGGGYNGPKTKKGAGRTGTSYL